MEVRGGARPRGVGRGKGGAGETVHGCCKTQGQKKNIKKILVGLCGRAGGQADWSTLRTHNVNVWSGPDVVAAMEVALAEADSGSLSSTSGGMLVGWHSRGGDVRRLIWSNGREAYESSPTRFQRLFLPRSSPSAKTCAF